MVLNYKLGFMLLIIFLLTCFIFFFNNLTVTLAEGFVAGYNI